jgi:hypothetical protein
MANPLHWFWYTATFKTKAVIIALIVILVSVALLWSCRDTKPEIEDDAKYQELAGQNTILREENAKLRNSAQDLMLKGQAVELERDGLRAELEKFGRQAAEGVKIQEKAAEVYAQETDTIYVNLPAIDRCKRYCSTRAELDPKYGCKPNIDEYCTKRYAATP